MADSSVREWVQFARMDHDTAKHLYQTMYPKPLEIICYHCQQAADILAYFKGFWIKIRCEDAVL